VRLIQWEKRQNVLQIPQTTQPPSPATPLRAVGDGLPPAQRPALLSPQRFSGAGSSVLWPLAALVLLLLFNLIFTDGFFHIEVRDGRISGSLIDVLNRCAPLMLLSLGMTLVIATGGIDLSVGAVMAITGAIAACLISNAGLKAQAPNSPLVAINVTGSVAMVVAIALGAALVAGIWNGLLVALVDVQPIVATLILMVAGRGVAQLLTDGQNITFSDTRLSYFGSGFLLGLPFPLFLVAGVLAFTAWLARGTALGLFIESVGNNPTASHYAGVNARFVKLAAYAFSGFCAGIAGLVVVADIKSADANNAGLYSELDAILAVSIGGTALTGGRFLLLGSIIGALLIQTLTTTILTRGVPPAATYVLKALLIVAVCLLQSEAFRASLKRRFSRRVA
jgi:simple sugar transport system permease protein